MTSAGQEQRPISQVFPASRSEVQVSLALEGHSDSRVYFTGDTSCPLRLLPTSLAPRLSVPKSSDEHASPQSSVKRVRSDLSLQAEA